MRLKRVCAHDEPRKLCMCFNPPFFYAFRIVTWVVTPVTGISGTRAIAPATRGAMAF